MIDLDLYMADIEERISPEAEDVIWHAWQEWIDRRNTSGPFVPPCRPASPSKLDWPHVNINDALDDVTLSVYRELESINHHLTRGTSAILRIRANFGVGSIPSAIGAPRFVMPYEADTLPNVLSIGEEKMVQWLDAPMPGLQDGNFEMIAKVSEVFKKLKASYPCFARYVHIEQPDLQSPLDNLELLWGSEFFYSLYDDPALVHAALDKLTRVTEQYMDHWIASFPQECTFASYFQHVDRGAICVRSDSAMNLSPDMYAEFVAPYDGRLIGKYGGIVHFCGRGDHYIDHLSRLPGLHGVNMSQPHLNDMEKIYAATIDRGIHLSLSVQPFEISRPNLQHLIFLP